MKSVLFYLFKVQSEERSCDWIFPLCAPPSCCLVPGTSWSPRPTYPALGSACASGHWCHPYRRRGSCSGPGPNQTRSCTAAAVCLTLSLDTVWGGVLMWRHERTVKFTLLLKQWQIHGRVSFLNESSYYCSITPLIPIVEILQHFPLKLF